MAFPMRFIDTFSSNSFFTSGEIASATRHPAEVTSADRCGRSRSLVDVRGLTGAVGSLLPPGSGDDTRFAAVKPQSSPVTGERVHPV